MKSSVYKISSVSEKGPNNGRSKSLYTSHQISKHQVERYLFVRGTLLNTSLAAKNDKLSGGGKHEGFYECLELLII